MCRSVRRRLDKVLTVNSTVSVSSPSARSAVTSRNRSSTTGAHFFYHTVRVCAWRLARAPRLGTNP
eukprot:1187095-Prorocentrum_minimum.AAC.1